MVSNVSFREQLKRMRPSFKIDRTDHPEPRLGAVLEETNDNLVPDGRPIWDDRFKIRKPDRSKLSAFFLSKTDTPGRNSSLPLKRLSARVWHEFKLTLLSEHVNCLLVFLPLTVVSNISAWDPILVFVFNYCAIIPLVSLISYATQEGSFGRLPHAIFCNTAEVLIAVISLRTGQIKFLGSFILGSLVNNLLLVSGTCFLLGGIVNAFDARGHGTQQHCASGTSRTGLSLMNLFSVLCIVINAFKVLDVRDEQDDGYLLIVSRGLSTSLLLLYLLYLFFSLHTHPNLFQAVTWYQYEDDDNDDDNDLEAEASVQRSTAVVILLFSIAMLVFCIIHLTRTFDAVIQTRNVTASSLGFVFIPFACSGAKNAIAVDLAMKDDMDRALTMAVEPSLQLALLVMPTMILLGWLTGQNVSLEFDTLETISFFLSVRTFSQCIGDGKSDYFEGAKLVGLYSIIGATVYFLQPVLG